ncbi:MAG TPA: hypothetical protein VD886_20315, partial [Herpetosiphonaceae bacterium]|nr:hypothetical protein [Herpetosiphonaceae bacterium]
MSDPARPVELAGPGAAPPALLERVFEAIPAGLAVHGAGADFPCLRHNRQFAAHLPDQWRGRDSLAGMPLRDLCAPAAYGPTRRLFELAVSAGEAASAPGAGPVFTAAGGSWRLVALHGRDGRADKIVAIAPDPRAVPG